MLRGKAAYVAEHRDRLIREVNVRKDHQRLRTLTLINDLRQARQDLAALSGHRRGRPRTRPKPRKRRSPSAPSATAGERLLTRLGLTTPTPINNLWPVLADDVNWLARAGTISARTSGATAAKPAGPTWKKPRGG